MYYVINESKRIQKKQSNQLKAYFHQQYLSIRQIINKCIKYTFIYFSSFVTCHRLIVIPSPFLTIL